MRRKKVSKKSLGQLSKKSEPLISKNALIMAKSIQNKRKTPETTTDFSKRFTLDNA